RPMTKRGLPTPAKNPKPPTPPNLLAVNLVEEAMLQFGNGGKSLDPKEGIVLHGPNNVGEPGRHPEKLGIGLIGTDTAIENVTDWFARCRSIIPAKADDGLLHPGFPGYSSETPFQSDLVERDDWRARIVTKEIEKITSLADARQRFDYAVNLITE